MIPTFILQILFLLFIVFLLAPAILIPVCRALGMQMGRRGFYRQQQSKMINPRDADARYQLGIIYLKWRYNRRAYGLLKEAVDIDHEQSEYRAALGHAEARLGMLDEAISNFKKALDLKSGQGYGSTHLAIANAYLKKNEIEQAEDWYKQTIQRNGSLAEAYCRLGTLERRQGNREDAREYLREAVGTANHPSPATRRRNIPWIWLARIRLLGLF